MKQRRIFVAVHGLGLSLVLVLGWIAWTGTRAAAQDTDSGLGRELTPQRAPESNLHESAALGTAFTYQGYLEDGDVPANGSYDFRFKLYDAASGGMQVGSTVTHEGVMVTDGAFAVDLGFGGDAFAGEDRWLEIAAKRPADSGYTTLPPRQPLRPAPYALYAADADRLDGNQADVFATASHNHWGADWSGSGIGLSTFSSDNIGLKGRTAGDWSFIAGVHGEASRANAIGVYGLNTGGGVGVYGKSETGLAGKFVGQVKVEGYVQLDTLTSPPPGEDCDHASERGRMKVDIVNDSLYICTDSGWDRWAASSP